MKRLSNIAIITAMAISFSQTALAKGLTASQIAETEIETIDENGNLIKSYEPADMVTPGQIVRYSIDYENPDTSAAENVVLVMPIPETMEYITHARADNAANVQFSYDSAQSFLDISEKPVNYDPHTMPVTHVKWKFKAPIAPRNQGRVSVSARLK